MALAKSQPVLLLVEDDLELLEITREFMAICGFQVVPTKNGRDALAALSERHIDAILTDMHLPGINAFKFIYSLREVRPSVPIYLMTGGTEVTLEDLQAAGVVDMFDKPLAWDTVGNRILEGLALAA